MSKQVPRKTTASAPTSAKPGASSGKTPTNSGQTNKSSAGKTSTAESKAAPRGTQAAGSTKARPAGATQRRPGRGLRNSDLAFLFVGLVLVVGLVWLVLSSSNSGSTNTNAGTTDTTGNTGAAPASTNAGASNAGQSTAGQGNGSGSTSRNSGKSPEETTPIAAGEQAPAFSLPDTDGKTYSLSQFKGKTVVLEFLATWCPHCQKDAPTMNQLSEAYKDKNVQVIGINASPYGHNAENEGDNKSQVSLDDVKWFRDSFTVTFPLLFDPDAQTGHVATAIDYGVKGYPTVYIINKDGIVVGQPKYPFTYEDLTAAVDQTLK